MGQIEKKRRAEQADQCGEREVEAFARAWKRLVGFYRLRRSDKTQARDRDKIFEAFGARLFVDPKSLLYLNGTTLEYEETLMRQGFVFQNPNAARNCGCGSSFTA